MATGNKKTTAALQEEILRILEARFRANMSRHKGISWDRVEATIKGNAGTLGVLAGMEATGGEPDVILLDGGRIAFFDCAAESPADRRSLCYDDAALETRKEAKPAGSAVETAGKMGIELLDEADYRRLQETGEYDARTSSWLKTHDDVRSRGGALFGDLRYGQVFVYHNGAQSYYAARGFRGKLVI